MKIAKAKQVKELKAARLNAIELLSRQPPSGAFAESERGYEGTIVNPHPSHYIKALHGDNDTMCCKSCGCWASKVKLRLLAVPCRGIKDGNKSTLRLLECGIMPTVGATILAHLKKRHGGQGKKCRW